MWCSGNSDLGLFADSPCGMLLFVAGIGGICAPPISDLAEAVLFLRDTHLNQSHATNPKNIIAHKQAATMIPALTPGDKCPDMEALTCILEDESDEVGGGWVDFGKSVAMWLIWIMGALTVYAEIVCVTVIDSDGVAVTVAGTV